MHARTRGWSIAVVFVLAVAYASAMPVGYAAVPIVEVGRPWLRDLSYSPDGAILGTLTDDRVELLDADTYEPLSRFSRGGRSFEFSPDGSEIIVFGSGVAWSVYDAASGELREEHLADADVTAISLDWRRVAYSVDDTVYIWDRDEQTVTSTLTDDPEPFLSTILRPNGREASTRSPRVTRLAFHPDGVRLLVGSHRSTVALWDTSTAELLQHYDVGTWLERIAVHPDGSEFAVHTYDHRTLSWGLSDVEPSTLNTVIAEGTLTTLEYGADGEYLWSAGNGLVGRLNLADGAEATSYAFLSESTQSTSTASVAVRPWGNQVASRASGGIAVWSEDSLEFEQLVDHGWGAGLSYDSTYAPARGEVITFGQMARRWRAPDARLVHAYEFPEYLDGVESSADGETAVGVMQGEARVFDTATGEVRFAVPHGAGYPRRYKLSPSGQYLATTTLRTMTVWSVATGESVATLSVGHKFFDRFAFTLDERRLVLSQTVRDEVLRVWDIETDTLVAEVQGGIFAATPQGVVHAVLPRDGSTDGLIEVRLLGEDTPLSAFEPPEGMPRRNLYNFGAIDPSGRFIMQQAEYPDAPQRRVRIHSTDTGALLGEYPYWPPIRFASDGEHIFAPGPNGGRALYRLEEFLNIVPADVGAQGKLLTPWGDVKRTQLLPNYPNPFNPETWIPFDLAEARPVKVVVYDDLGRAVRHVDLGHMPAGAYRTRDRAAYWDGRNDAGEPVASGAYFIELSAGSLRQTRRTTLAK